MDENEQSRKDTFEALAYVLHDGDLATLLRLYDSSQHPISLTTTSISPYLPAGRFLKEPVQCHPLGVASMFSHPDIVSHLLSIPEVLTHIDDPVFNLCKCSYHLADPRALVNYGMSHGPGHWTALHLAICQGKENEYDYNPRIISPDHERSLQIVKDLIIAGASLTGSADPSHEEKITILHTAALRGRLDILYYLLSPDFPRKAEVDVNARDYRGRTPLHYAALRYSSALIDVEDLPCIQFLLSMGVHLESRDTFSQTPFTLALNFGCLSSAKHLLRKGAKYQFPFLCMHTNTLCYPLHVLAHSYHTIFASSSPLGDKPVFRATWEAQRSALLKTIIRLSPPDFTPIDCGFVASVNFDPEEAEVLHPLAIAARDGSNPATVLSCFLDLGADPNARSGSKGKWTTALHQAVRSQPCEDRLMEWKVHPDYDAESGRIYAIEEGGNVIGEKDAPPPRIDTPTQLHEWTAILKCVVLAMRGAKIRTQNSEGQTVLDLAIRRSEEEESVYKTDEDGVRYRFCPYKFVGAWLFSLIRPYKDPPHPLLDGEDRRYLALKLREVVVKNPLLAYKMVAAGVDLAVLKEKRHEVWSEANRARINRTLSEGRVDPHYAMDFIELLVGEMDGNLEAAVYRAEELNML